MAKSLVIVESPAKAKTIGKYLGKDFAVKASLGHIKDLPKNQLAVDVDNGFEPTYVIIEGKKSSSRSSARQRTPPRPSTSRPTPTARAKPSATTFRRSFSRSAAAAR